MLAFERFATKIDIVSCGCFVRLLPRQQNWTIDDLKEEIASQGIAAAAKEVYNSLGYLVRKGHIRRVGYGRYLVGEHLFGRHAAVHQPDAARLAVLSLDVVEKPPQCRLVRSVAGQHLIGQRQAFGRHNQGNDDLHTIGSMIARVPEAALVAFRERWIRLEIGARQIGWSPSPRRSSRSGPGVLIRAPTETATRRPCES